MVVAHLRATLFLRLKWEIIPCFMLGIKVKDYASCPDCLWEHFLHVECSLFSSPAHNASNQRHGQPASTDIWENRQIHGTFWNHFPTRGFGNHVPNNQCRNCIFSLIWRPVVMVLCLCAENKVLAFFIAKQPISAVFGLSSPYCYCKEINSYLLTIWVFLINLKYVICNTQILIN